MPSLPMTRVCGVILGLAAFANQAWLPAAGAPPERPVETTLDALSPLASADEISRRLLSPTTFDRLQRAQATSGVDVKQQTIHVGEVRYDLFVPPAARDKDYGLLVFVSPSDDRFPLPRDWWKALARDHVIFIAARDSGNARSVLDRRVPLALHGYGLVRRRYRLDPARVYVGGFSGGSRVAQMVALGYPDVFRGALLLAGSEPIGSKGFVPPPRELTRLFQARTRIVFSTGSEDLPNRGRDMRTRRNFEELCVQGVAMVPQTGLDHWVPSRGGFTKALRALQQPVVPAASFDACAQRLQATVDAGLDEVAALVDAGDMAAAGERLGELDDLYGGLAAPRSVELARIIAARLQDSGAGGG